MDLLAGEPIYPVLRNSAGVADGDDAKRFGKVHVDHAIRELPDSRRSHDEAVATRLWRSCEQLTGVRWLD